MEVERLGEVFIKAGPQTELLLAAALVRGQGNRFFPGLPLFCLDHEIEPVAIGQADVADQDIEAQILQ